MSNSIDGRSGRGDALVHNSVTETLSSARRFLDKHGPSPVLDTTYGYFTTHPVAPLNRARLLNIVARIAGAPGKADKPLRILDLACGGGLVASAIDRCLNGDNAGSAVVAGIDADPREIATAGQFAEFLGGSCMFINLPIAADTGWKQACSVALNGKPDIVLMAYALHHLANVDEVIADLAAWLDVGALVIVNEENLWSPTFRLKHILRSLLQRDTEDEAHRSIAGWRELFERNGFETMDLQGVDMLPLLGTLAPQFCWSILFDARRA